MSDAFTVNSDGSRSRKLLEPIKGPNDTEIPIIRLRQPKYRDIMAWGDPSSTIVMQGAVVPHDEMGIVVKYVEALATDEHGQVIMPGLLNQLDYRDALALKDAVLDFFTMASTR